MRIIMVILTLALSVTLLSLYGATAAANPQPKSVNPSVHKPRKPLKK